jgi:hypothetical protein
LCLTTPAARKTSVYLSHRQAERLAALPREEGRPQAEIPRDAIALTVLAHRYNTTRLMRFDERHFRAVTPLGGGSFRLLPADL